MFVKLLLLVVGFIALIKGADLFVDGSSSLAKNFKVPKILIGLTLVAFGTSAPEFAISVKAILSGSGEMILGNVIGSNILNLLLIIGIVAMIKPITIKRDTYKKELPMTVFGTCLLSLLFLDNLFDKTKINTITRVDGLIVVLFFLAFCYYLISIILKNKKELKEIEKPEYSIFKSVIYTIIGIVFIVIGGNLVVESASYIARALNVSDRLIALTVIALGTSLPELVTGITAALKGEEDILIGNIVGSSIFNICVVVGIPVVLFGNITPVGFTYIDLLVFVLSSLLVFIFSYSKREINKKEGLLMVLIFLIYYCYIIIK